MTERIKWVHRSPKQMLQWFMFGNMPGHLANCNAQLYSLSHRLPLYLPKELTVEQRGLLVDIINELTSAIVCLQKVTLLLIELRQTLFISRKPKQSSTNFTVLNDLEF